MYVGNKRSLPIVFNSDNAYPQLCLLTDKFLYAVLRSIQLRATFELPTSIRFGGRVRFKKWGPEAPDARLGVTLGG